MIRPPFIPRLAVLLLSLAAAQTAQAQVFRCVLPDGRVEYSGVPCAGSSRGGEVQVRPNVIDTSGSRENALRAENARLRDELSRSRERGSEPGQIAPGRTRSDLQAEKANSYECSVAKREYSVVAGTINPTRGQVDAARLSMYSACGMQEPDRSTVIIRR